MTWTSAAWSYVQALIVLVCLRVGSADTQEIFVYVGPDASRPPRSGEYVLVALDPRTGSSETKQRVNRSERPLRAEFVDRHGNHLPLRTVPGATVKHPATLELAVPGRGPQHCFEEATIPLSIKASVSPDGTAVVLFHPPIGFRIDDGTACHQPEIGWKGVKSFSWSDDSRKVTFYYTETVDDDDLFIQKHGLAVLETNGNLTVVQKPSDDLATPVRPLAKNVPPGWSKENQYLYFTAGVAAGDPLRQRDDFDELHRPTAVYRVNLTTLERETLCLGVFTALSHSDDYVIVSAYPFKRADGAWRIKTVRLNLTTREVTDLPEDVRLPRFSPSGAYAACSVDQKTVFLDTRTWTRISGPLAPPETGERHAVEEWYSQYRWIVLEPESMQSPD